MKLNKKHRQRVRLYCLLFRMVRIRYNNRFILDYKDGEEKGIVKDPMKVNYRLPCFSFSDQWKK